MAPIFNMADQQSLQGCKKDELKTWLKARGLKVSGRKQDLITRVTKAEQDGTELLVNREMREKNEREKRMIDKLKTPFEDLPNPKTLNNWTEDLSYLPVITVNEIKDYLVYGKCKFYAKEDMKCFKQLKAFKFFMDGHVQDIKLSIINATSNYCFVKQRFYHQCAQTVFMRPGFPSLKKLLKSYLQIVTAQQGKQHASVCVLVIYVFTIF